MDGGDWLRDLWSQLRGQNNTALRLRRDAVASEEKRTNSRPAELGEERGTLTPAGRVGRQLGRLLCSPCGNSESKVTDLILSGCLLGVEGAEELSLTLAEGRSVHSSAIPTGCVFGQLRDVSLHGNFLGNRGATRLCMAFFGGLGPDQPIPCPVLASLDLSYNRLDDGFTTNFVKLLSPSGSQGGSNTSLTTLDLSQNSLTERSAKALSAAIRPRYGGVAVSRLRLGENEVNLAGVRALLACTRDNWRVTLVDVSSQRVPTCTTQAHYDALGKLREELSSEGRRRAQKREQHRIGLAAVVWCGRLGSLLPLEVSVVIARYMQVASFLQVT
jgi:Leucine Rich repeat